MESLEVVMTIFIGSCGVFILTASWLIVQMGKDLFK